MNDEETLKEAFSFLNLEEVDSNEVESLYNLILPLENTPEKVAEIAPNSKLAARSWVMAYAHLDERNDWLKEYQSHLEKRYILPIKEEMEKNETAKTIIKSGIKSFLDNAEEDSVKFPDIGTVSRFNPPISIVYPENEEEFAKKIYETGEDSEKKFVRVKYSFDKNAVKSEHKETGKLPINGIETEKNEPTVRFQKAKSKK